MQISKKKSIYQFFNSLRNSENYLQNLYDMLSKKTIFRLSYPER